MSEPEISKHSFAATLAVWDRLLAGIEANQDDLPALEDCRAQLEAALKDAREAHARRLGYQEKALQETREIHAVLKLGRDLVARLQSGVRLLYGRRSPKLAEFGMRALLPRAKRKVGPRCGVKGCPLEATATAK